MSYILNTNSYIAFMLDYAKKCEKGCIMEWIETNEENTFIELGIVFIYSFTHNLTLSLSLCL
jgi:hypothetical protein